MSEIKVKRDDYRIIEDFSKDFDSEERFKILKCPSPTEDPEGFLLTNHMMDVVVENGIPVSIILLPKASMSAYTVGFKSRSIIFYGGEEHKNFYVFKAVDGVLIKETRENLHGKTTKNS